MATPNSAMGKLRHEDVDIGATTPYNTMFKNHPSRHGSASRKTRSWGELYTQRAGARDRPAP